MHRPITLLIAMLALGGLAVPAGAAADVSGSAIVTFLNAQRAAQGLPAGIVEDPALSAWCVSHNRYSAANRVLEHDERTGRAGYSPMGRDAARVSVLYGGGGPWTAARNPFEQAPIHLHQLLAPRLDRMGAAENDGYGCATTLASRGRRAPSSDVSYSYPGDGARAWPPAQTAFEGPYTPGQRVGIPAGTQTGPYLYVLYDGPGLSPAARARVTSAALTGPDGRVALATVDNTTPGLEGLLPPGAELIPRRPLRSGATYTATVRASVADAGERPRTFSRTWSFTTGTTQNAAPRRSHAARARVPRRSAGPFRLTARAERRRPREVRIRVRCTRACGLVASGTVRAQRWSTRLPTRRASLRRAGARTLRFRLSPRAAKRLARHGVRTVRVRVIGVDAKRRRVSVTLRSRI